MVLDCRAAAARVLAGVMNGQSLNQALPPQQGRVAGRDRALLQELCYGSLRHWPRLAGLAGQLLDKPLRDKDRDVFALILVGLYQLAVTRVPDHAAVAATVGATRALNKGWARGLVNALLRRYQRERDALEGALDPAARAAQPPWLYRQLQDQWGEATDAIAAAGNSRPPMVLRVNLARIPRAQYRQQLAEAGIASTPGDLAASALYLERAVDVGELPGFAEGLASVQDEAAQLAAELLDCRAGDRVLDACAAPGGKTCHILERNPRPAALVAMEVDPERAARIRDNLRRLELDAEVVVADAAHPPADLEPASFDRILVDAPCSATGVIRRHPDIKLLRRESDIGQLAGQQAAILDGLWPLLKPGGQLLYVTCSILEAENSAVVTDFIGRRNDARLDPIAVPWGEARPGGRQLLPREGGPDGLFFARLLRGDG
ncbi:16S rRNA (cytosine(967)-C(5))-methyltransferase RsmB [Parahaliea mediterranea]|uniref:16S rRNA (cytosine(967)-C(5))-methyltransferase n=1 Tax=Parahaliea mediterranea TaxID=651086 RepID=A0A939DF40_9GAMM|nr:16S rRNA (cytosine(967)-C(5))-methyltransferase RsmB [Parahaliea mediterranea]MBN7797120.1 16S rRNA (cytosine(967)-C(5))-methyltransferase RsmB [Parahaliea mediterranea]